MSVVEHYDIVHPRVVHAVIQAEFGNRKGTRQFPTNKVEAWSIETALDNDSDAFSIDIGMARQTGDKSGTSLMALIGRDVEVRVGLFSGTTTSSLRPVFYGYADKVVYDSDDGKLSMNGRDISCLATDSDMEPAKFKNIRPDRMIAKRAVELGFRGVKIPKLSVTKLLQTDGSESVWDFWYRSVREKGSQMWLWAEPLGILRGGMLNYSLAPTYFFGHPGKGQPFGKWRPVERVLVTKSTQGRIYEEWVYGSYDKTAVPFIAVSRDKTIATWNKKVRKVSASSSAATPAKAQAEADDDINDSIVGATEIEITISDSGADIQQNYMAHVNLPDIEIVGMYFVVGVSKQGGPDGYSQVIRLREKDFALPRHVPQEPKPDTSANTVFSQDLLPGALEDAASNLGGVRWGSSFLKATQEWHGQWDFGQFMAVLLAICNHETGFTNVRHKSDKSTANGLEWLPFTAFNQPNIGAIVDNPLTAGAGPQKTGTLLQYQQAFANEHGNPKAPNYPDAEAVGPMQLLTQGYKEWADQLGWNGVPKSGEYDGGRWNPDSNIRAAGRAFASKLANANPTDKNGIYVGVEGYYGSTAANNAAYAAVIKAAVEGQWAATVAGMIAAASTLAPGASVSRGNLTIRGVQVPAVPTSTPKAIQDAINWCYRHSDAQYDASRSTGYDCSSFVSTAYSEGAGLSTIHPSDDTASLLSRGRFPEVEHDNLLPGDLLFFTGEGGGPLTTDNVHHVTMYLVDGNMISMSNPANDVRIVAIGNPYYAARYVTARRIVQWEGREFAR